MFYFGRSWSAYIFWPLGPLLRKKLMRDREGNNGLNVIELIDVVDWHNAAVAHPLNNS